MLDYKGYCEEGGCKYRFERGRTLFINSGKIEKRNQ